jgi:hypothetical protein
MCIKLVRKSVVGCEVLFLSHKWFLGTLPTAAMLEVHWLKWMYFHEHGLLYLQHCCQGHNPAIAASHRDYHFFAIGSGCFMQR